MPVEEEESSDSTSNSEEEEEQQGKKATAVTSPTPIRSIFRRVGQTTAAVPPAASPSSSSSSSSEEGSEEESDDEEEDSEDEDDEPKPVKSQPRTPVRSQKASQSKAASSGPVLAKPLNSKPMDGKTVKPSDAASQAKPKRPADSSKEDESRKKKKKKKEDEAEAEDLAADVEVKKEVKSDGSRTPQDHKKLFQRVWDADDEINLLRTLLDYTKEVGSSHDLNGFFEFSRKDLEKFKKTQLVDKVRKLKKKYENIVAREKNSGKTTVFKNPHEIKAFSLSQLIWEEKGKDTPQKDANEASGQKSPRKDGDTAAKKSKNNDGGEEQLNNNRTKVSARKREEPDSSVSKDENHVRFFENVDIGVGRIKEDELGSTVVNMVEVVDKWIKLAEQSKVKDLQERQRKLEGRMLEIHSEHLEIESARAKLALEAFKTAKAGRSRQ